MSCRQLAFAAIDHHQVRQGFLVAQPTLEVTSHDFSHRCEIVAAFDRLDPKFPVFAALRTTILEPHGRSDGVRALGSGDVEADQGTRQPLQAELAAELIDGISCPLFGLHRRQLELLQQVPRVLLGERDQLAPRPTLRDLDLAVG